MFRIDDAIKLWSFIANEKERNQEAFEVSLCRSFTTSFVIRRSKKNKLS